LAKLILIRGLAGAGKSTLARSISMATKIPLLDKDDIGDVIFPLMAADDANKCCYSALWAQAQRQLSLGIDIIVDSPMRRREDYDNILSWVEALDAAVKSIRVTCTDIPLWKRRLEDRNRTMPPHRQWTWEQHQKHYGTLSVDPFPEELTVDSAMEASANLKLCLEYISR
jgi:predicted kinase